MQVVEWGSAADPGRPEVHTSDLGGLRLRDGAAYTVAFRDPGADPADLVPPSLSDLDELAALDGGGPPSGDGGDAGGPSTTRSLPPPGCAPAPPAAPGLTFRPVLRVGGATDCDGSWFADGEGLAYELGPPLPEGMVESAEAEVDPTGGWSVEVTLRPGSPGIDDLNSVAAVCHDVGPECPTGQLALVVAGEVVTAPVMSRPAFADPVILISGPFSEDEARAIADAID